MHNFATIWMEVSCWPTEQRLELATRLLQSLQQPEETANGPQERREALRQLIGIWKTEQPPGDEDVERIVEQAKKRKYG